MQPLALATPHTARPALRPPLALDACPGGPWAPTERSLRARGRGGGGGGERPERACARVRGELAGDGMKAPPLPPAPPLAPPPQPAGWLERYKTWAKANAASLEVRSAPQRAARQGRGGKKGARGRRGDGGAHEAPARAAGDARTLQPPPTSESRAHTPVYRHRRRRTPPSPPCGHASPTLSQLRRAGSQRDLFHEACLGKVLPPPLWQPRLAGEPGRLRGSRSLPPARLARRRVRAPWPRRWRLPLSRSAWRACGRACPLTCCYCALGGGGCAGRGGMVRTRALREL